MKSRHITEILDEKRFAELNDAELSVIKSHTDECAACRYAFESARVVAVLLSAHARRETVQPAPFFEAKVMNALRERQLVKNPFQAFRRWWQASYGLVGAMVLMVLMMVGLTVFAPSSNATDIQAEVPNGHPFSTDTVIINQRELRELTPEQALEVIYGERRDLKKK